MASNIRALAQSAILGNPIDPAKKPNNSAVVDVFRLIEEYVTALTDGSAEIQGGWSAASGAFPGSGTADIGQAWIVTTAGTTGGVTFRVGDRIIAVKDNPSTSVYATNWVRLPSNVDPIIYGSDAGAGTPNAVKVTTSGSLSGDTGQLIHWKNSKANTSTTVTVEFNGDGNLYPIEAPDGTEPTEGSFLAGLNVVGYLNGGIFVLLTDLPTAAQLAAAQTYVTQAAGYAAAASTSLTQMQDYYDAVTTALLTGQGLLYGPEELDGATTVITLSEAVSDRADINVVVGGGAWLPPVTEFYDVDGDQLTLKTTFPVGTSIFVRRANMTLGVGATGAAGRSVLASDTAEAIRSFLRLDGWCRPEDFGDWTGTNDTAILQAAIDDGRPILLKRNRVYVASSLRPRSGMTIIGDGTPTIKQLAATNDNLIGPAYSGGFPVDVTWDGVVIDGVILDGDKANQTHGIDNKQMLIRGKYTNFIFRRIKCINSVRGDIRLTDSRYGLIEMCQLIGGGKWTGSVPATGEAAQNIAISGTNSLAITIRRNYIEGIGADVFAAYPSYTTGVNNVCIIVENTSFGIDIIENYITKCSNEMIQYIRFVGVFEPLLTFRPGKSVVAKNFLDGQNVSSFGCNIGENADDVQFVNNHIRGMKSHGMKVSGWCRGTLIQGNTIEDCDGSGIVYVSGNVNASGEVFGSARIIANEIRGCGANGLSILGNGSGDVIVGMQVIGNICKNNGQITSGSAGIRIAASITDAIIQGNSCFDDQDTKTQAYGMSLGVPSGGGGTLARNMVANNNLQGNLTASADVNSSARSGFTFFGNLEGTNPQLYAAKVSYSLNGGTSTTTQFLASAYAGRALWHAIRPTADAGSNAYGGAIVTFGASAAGTPTYQVQNLSPTARAVGDAYVFAA